MGALQSRKSMLVVMLMKNSELSHHDFWNKSFHREVGLFAVYKEQTQKNDLFSNFQKNLPLPGSVTDRMLICVVRLFNGKYSAIVL